jgi:hypothetical protein
MNGLELFFLNMGASWEASRILPFVFLLVISVVPLLLLRKYRLKSLMLDITLKSVLVISILSIYFIYNPIYRGDITDLSRTENISKEMDAPIGLRVYVLPNCPYCLESLELMDVFHKRNPKIGIEYVIIGSGNGGKILPKVPSYIKVTHANINSGIKRITKGSYPCFVVKKDKSLLIWNNSEFGLKAFDVVEEALSI